MADITSTVAKPTCCVSLVVLGLGSLALPRRARLAVGWPSIPLRCASWCRSLCRKKQYEEEGCLAGGMSARRSSCYTRGVSALKMDFSAFVCPSHPRLRTMRCQAQCAREVLVLRRCAVVAGGSRRDLRAGGRQSTRRALPLALFRMSKRRLGRSMSSCWLCWCHDLFLSMMWMFDSGIDMLFNSLVVSVLDRLCLGCMC